MKSSSLPSRYSCFFPREFASESRYNPAVYRKSTSILAFEPKPSLQVQAKTNIRSIRGDSFIKKTQNRFYAKYFNDNSAKEVDKLKEYVQGLLQVSDSDYMLVADELEFSDWQKQLLSRDLKELRELYQHFSQLDKCQVTSILQALRKLSEAVKKKPKSTEPRLIFFDFIRNLRAHPDTACFSLNPNLMEQGISHYLRAEILAANITIKTQFEGYAKGLMKSYGVPSLLSLNLMRKNWECTLYYGNSMPARNIRRLQKEEALSRTELFTKSNGYAVLPSSHSPLVWCGVVLGPPGSYYEGGIFYLLIRLPIEYPFKPPSITFISNIFHPMVFETSGTTCLDVLDNMFSPALTLDRLVSVFREILENPQTDDPLNTDALALLAKNPGEFKKEVQRCILKYW